ncbi:MAG TPA: excalibur calcium-binding domain-containing protein [Pseudonocardiaceae bacterium]
MRVPVAPDARYSTHVGGSHRHGGSGGRSSLAYVIGGILLLGVIVLFVSIALIVGGLALLGYGSYLGVLARQRGSRRTTEAPTIPIPTQPPAPAVVGRAVFGLEPSYGLGGACILVGFVMFIGGIAAAGSAHDSQSQTTSANHDSPPSPSLQPTTPPPATSREPLFAVPMSPIPTTAAAPQAAPTVHVETPSEPTTVQLPQRVTPQRGNDGSGDAIYYKNCSAARAAGAAPIKRGGAGYRPALDRDNDGIACE